jgi:iron complex outermembrane receptor protein/hemoglobin/transferrin/lactoferrin receptor protein
MLNILAIGLALWMQQPSSEAEILPETEEPSETETLPEAEALFETETVSEEETPSEAETASEAQTPSAPKVVSEAETPLEAEAGLEEETPRYETTVRASGKASEQARSVVRQADIDKRLPRSAPDALRFEPGVFVQQTAHAQGSAYIRGLTGQQTLMLFDGIRLNTSTYRQGPNQYFFLVDTAIIDSIEVLRGGGSTAYGADALGGVLVVNPIRPSQREGFFPSVSLRGSTADGEMGGRVQTHASLGEKGRLLVGMGARRAGLLRSGGPIHGFVDGKPPEVPRFAEDGKTQLGTGFVENTADIRFEYAPSPNELWTVASIGFWQSDAPRTDQCPPALARFDECLRYERQDRLLSYATWSRRTEKHAVHATLSWQHQYEKRRNDRPASFVLQRDKDSIETFGASLAYTFPWWLGSLRLGADAYVDFISSNASLLFTDVDMERPLSRGQYLSGSNHLTSAAFASNQWEYKTLTLNTGFRLGLQHAYAPGEATSGSTTVNQSWWPWAAHLGAQWQLHPALSLLASVDRSFRAPNLDDLTARQRTGPGFQFENPNLKPETASSAEWGVRLKQNRLRAELWGFATRLDGLLLRIPRGADACPPESPACTASNARYQLVNAQGASWLFGSEAVLRLRPLRPLVLQATIAWVWGDSPHPALQSNPQTTPRRMPLSRLPPLNGTLEANWQFPFGLQLGSGFRWAFRQTRLALNDFSDVRIPLGGTPGFAVVDLRASYRFQEKLLLALVLENLFDSAYRYHGSSINGPGRSLSFRVDLATF